LCLWLPQPLCSRLHAAMGDLGKARVRHMNIQS
jgi:hypothetical protein